MSIACVHGPTGLAMGQDFSYYLSSLSALLLYTSCVPITPVYNIMHIYIYIYIYISKPSQYSMACGLWVNSRKDQVEAHKSILTTLSQDYKLKAMSRSGWNGRV